MKRSEVPIGSCWTATIIRVVISFLRFGGAFEASQMQCHFQECVTCYVNSLWPTAWNANPASENCFVFNNIQKSRGPGSWRCVAHDCFKQDRTESLCTLKQLTNFIKLNQLDLYSQIFTQRFFFLRKKTWEMSQMTLPNMDWNMVDLFMYYCDVR